MIPLRPISLLLCAMLLAACAKEVPPRTVTEFQDDPLLLEAVLLRCTENRAESRYDAECVNAREAVKLIEAREVAARRAELEAMSERKRESLRRTQQAAAEARRRASEAARLRAEMEYQAQFGLPLPTTDPNSDAMQGNEPVAFVPAPNTAGSREDSDPQAMDPVVGSNAPAIQVAEPEVAETQAADLDAIRKEMRRRNDDSGASP
jgi:hypothetical protein